MLLLGRRTADALREVAARLSDRPPDSADAILSIRETASRCLALASLAAAAGEVLEEQGFVQVRGLPVDAAPNWAVAWACLLGEPFIDPAVGSAIVPAHVRPAQTLMGNQLRRLPLHTDYSMLQLPPRLTLSFCQRHDPTRGMGGIDVVDVEECVFGIENATEFKDFWNLPLPFASRAADGDIVVFESPILGRHPSRETLLARYHRSRIAQGFRRRGVPANDRECSTMLAFEEFVARRVQTLTPKAGDLTIIDNHRCLHGRGRCSVELDTDGTSSGRKMLFVFAN